MSGSNPGSEAGSSFGGGGSSAAFDCNSVSIKTNIMSPDPAVLGKLAKGDVLSISLRTVTGPLDAVTDAGQVLGTVLTMELASLIKCINDGNLYKAEILSISGGNIQILITRR